MPYIVQARRAHVAELLSQDIGHVTPGDLNFVITTLLIEWLAEQPGYTGLNAAVGVLECAKLELYRRMVAPYEDTKIAENGDVYPKENT